MRIIYGQKGPDDIPCTLYDLTGSVYSRPLFLEFDDLFYRHFRTEDVKRISRVLTSRFDSLVEGVDYERKVGQVPGRSRSVVVPLRNEVSGDGPLPSYDRIQLKGSVFDPKRVNEERFDLIEAHRVLEGEDIPRVEGSFRTDSQATPDGVIIPRIRPNEPLEAMFGYLARQEFRVASLALRAGCLVHPVALYGQYQQAVDVPEVAAAFGHSQIVPLGVVGTLLPKRSEEEELNLHSGTQFLNKAQGGYADCEEEGNQVGMDAWKDIMGGVVAASALGLRVFYDRGFVHLSGHGGNIEHTVEMVSGGTTALSSIRAGSVKSNLLDYSWAFMRDLHDSEVVKDMPAPQRIAYHAIQIRQSLLPVLRVDEQLKENLGVDVGLGRAYMDACFYDVDPELRRQLGEAAVRGKVEGGYLGLPLVDSVLHASTEEHKPLMDFSGSPLVRALRQVEGV
ncbi:Uncharacterised protein [uncultured archaeon]|nr:Uncharacterised protein [uncultured archaeon]